MKGKLKSFFAAIGYLLLDLIIKLSVSFAGGIVVSILYFATQASNAINGATISDAEVENLMNLTLRYTNVFLLVSAIVSVGVFILIYKIRKRNYKQELQIKKTPNFNIIYAIFLGAACWLFNSGILELIYQAGIFTDHFNYMADLLSGIDQGNVIIALLTVGIIVPFAEEFLFRGVLYSTLNKRISIKWTIIIQGVLFGIYHGNLIQGAYATLLGILFGYVTYKTKSLWPAVIMHMVNNTIATIIPYIVSENFGGNIVNILFAVVGTIGVVIFTMLIKNKNHNNEEVIDYNNINNLG